MWNMPLGADLCCFQLDFSSAGIIKNIVPDQIM
jgi:hypothetical protein